MALPNKQPLFHHFNVLFYRKSLQIQNNRGVITYKNYKYTINTVKTYQSSVENIFFIW